MSDISTTESSLYVGLEDGSAGTNEDTIRVESAETVFIVYEDGTKKELNSSHLSDGIISQLYKDIDKNLNVKNAH